MRPVQLIASIGTDDLARFERSLGAFLRESHARCALLIDRTGRVLASVGETAGFDLTMFASLVAADFLANDQLATLLGEAQFWSVYHHGDRHSMVLVDLAGWAILAALFDDKTTLGMIRVKARRCVPEFRALFDELAARGPSGAVAPMDVGWAADVEREIDRLFAE